MRLLLNTVPIRLRLALTLVDFDPWHFLPIKLHFIQFLLRIKKRCLFILFGIMNGSLLCVIVNKILVIVLNDRNCFCLCLWQSVKSLWYLNIKWRQKLFLIIFQIIIFSDSLEITITFRDVFVIGWNWGNIPS